MLLLSNIRSWKTIVVLTLSMMVFARVVFEIVLNVKLP
jgi:hypothetical protein